MTYKCVFSDIDGTLLNSNHQISERTKNKIQELYQSDIPFVLVSARMPKGMSYFLDELKIKEPMVCYSGGLILDENKEVIYSKGFSVEMAKRLFEYIKYYYQVPVSFYIENRWMVDEIDEGIKKTKGKYEVIVDRVEAITKAIQIANKTDIIVLAGKGHEPYQEINGVKHPFDERIIVNDIISKINKKGKN